MTTKDSVYKTCGVVCAAALLYEAQRDGWGARDGARGAGGDAGLAPLSSGAAAPAPGSQQHSAETSRPRLGRAALRRRGQPVPAAGTRAGQTPGAGSAQRSAGAGLPRCQGGGRGAGGRNSRRRPPPPRPGLAAGRDGAPSALPSPGPAAPTPRRDRAPGAAPGRAGGRRRPTHLRRGREGKERLRLRPPCSDDATRAASGTPLPVSRSRGRLGAGGRLPGLQPPACSARPRGPPPAWRGAVHAGRRSRARRRGAVVPLPHPGAAALGAAGGAGAAAGAWSPAPRR